MVSIVPVNSYAAENGEQNLTGYETVSSEDDAAESLVNENQTEVVSEDTEKEEQDSNLHATEEMTEEVTTVMTEDYLGQTEEETQDSSFIETEEIKETQSEVNLAQTEDNTTKKESKESKKHSERSSSDTDNKRMEEDRAAKANIIPYVLNPERETDNLEQLTAGSAARNTGVTLLDYGYPKYFWINRFGQNPKEDYLEWTVQSNLEQTESYYVWMHLDASAGTSFKLEVIQGDDTSETTFTKAASGWEAAEFGEIKIPGGTSRIRFTKSSTDNKNCQIKGMDMIRSSDKESYEQRVNQYLMDGSQAKLKFSESGYGLFFQAGVWGYPEFGDKKDKETSTNEFDVESFVDTVEVTGSKFIIWSLTWWQYRMQMPLTTVNQIVGHDKFTTQRNLVGEIAAECKSRGIDFYLYYHQGLQQENEWKEKQDFPVDFNKTGLGDKSLFFENWISVISEVGENLGENLDGWFFDDGCVYYPAPFEALGAASKAGNPNRVITYNSWQGTAVTKFQDITFGEGGWADPEDTENGIFQSGKEKGLLQVGMPMLNNGNWGITSANETIETTVSAAVAAGKIKSAMERKVPMALNIKMWEDGRIGQQNLDLFFAIQNELNGTSPETIINDNDSKITYSEGWKYGTNYSQEFNKDVHYHKNPSEDPWVEYTFTGEGIGVIGRAETWACDIKVFIDGVEDTTNNWTFKGTGSVNQYEGYKVTGLENKEHTIKVIYMNGIEAQFDAFKVYRKAGTENRPVKKIEVRLDNGKNVVGIGSSYQVLANIKPESAADKEVVWSVADENGAPTDLAEINDTGMLKINSNIGKIKVTATLASDPQKSGSSIFLIQALPVINTCYGNEEDIIRSGKWTLRSSSKSCDSVNPEDTASLVFEGDYVEWYGVMGDDHGIANVYIDDEYITNVDCYSTERKTDTLLFRSGKLGEGLHTIKIEVQELRNQDSSNRYIEVYRFITEKTMKLNTSVSLKAKTAVYTGKPIQIDSAVTVPVGLGVTYQYKMQGAKEWSFGAPTEAGLYDVKALFPGDDNYQPSEGLATLLIEKPKEQPRYAISIKATTGGTIKISKNTAVKGERIRVTVTPKAGYRLKANSLKFNNTVIPQKNGVYSFIMPEKTAAITSVFELSVPSAVTLKASNHSTSSIKLTYNKSKDAKGYVVYRKEKSAGKWIKIKVTSSTSYTDKGRKTGVLYQYKVKPYNKAGSKVIYGKESKILTTATAPKKLTIYAVQSGKGKVKVSWKKGTLADGFVVEMKTGNGNYKKVRTLQSKSSLSATISGLKKGTTYRFRVRGYKKCSNTQKVYGIQSASKKVSVK